MADWTSKLLALGARASEVWAIWDHDVSTLGTDQIVFDRGHRFGTVGAPSLIRKPTQEMESVLFGPHITAKCIPSLSECKIT